MIYKDKMEHENCLKEQFHFVLKRERQNIQYASIHLVNFLDEYLLVSENPELIRERQVLKGILIPLYQCLDQMLNLVKPWERNDKMTNNRHTIESEK